MNLALLSSPFLGALIGWGTNYLAIRMLFRPRRPFPLASTSAPHYDPSSIFSWVRRRTES